MAARGKVVAVANGDAHARKQYEPISALINKPRFRGMVTEVKINGPRRVILDVAGTGPVSVPSGDVAWLTLSWFEGLCQFLAAREGVVWTKEFPVLACRTPTGDRFQGQVGPNFSNGMFAAIRVVRLLEVDWSDFEISDEQRALVEETIEQGRSLFISGGTASGKTTFLRLICHNVLPRDIRTITIQDVDELELPHEDQASILVSRSTGVVAIDWADAFDICMRSAPDLIIPGELSIKSAFPMLQVFDSGHRGPPTTMHANSPLDALRGFRRRVALGGGSSAASETADMLEFFADNVGAIVQIKKVKGRDRRLITDVVRPRDLLDKRSARDDFAEREQAFDKRVDTGLVRALLMAQANGLPDEFRAYSERLVGVLIALGLLKPEGRATTASEDAAIFSPEERFQLHAAAGAS